MASAGILSLLTRQGSDVQAHDAGPAVDIRDNGAMTDVGISMPDADNIIFSGTLEKCAFSSTTNWREVSCCVTAESLFIAKKMDDIRCLDRVPVNEMFKFKSNEAASSWDRDAVTRMPSAADENFSTFQRDAAADMLYHFSFETVEKGHNDGRTYRFRVGSEGLRAEWLKVLKETKRNYERNHRQSFRNRMVSTAKRLHDHNAFQRFFGAVIMGSFIMSLTQTEMIPDEGSEADKIFMLLDAIFTVLFTVELVITFFAHAGRAFFEDAWRNFDTVIVVVSWIGLSGADLPAIKSIRAARVLRAVRLLKKSRSLKPMVDALFASILPVANAMSLLALITGIYARCVCVVCVCCVCVCVCVCLFVCVFALCV
jgi:hypothetical protein